MPLVLALLIFATPPTPPFPVKETPRIAPIHQTAKQREAEAKQRAEQRKKRQQALACPTACWKFSPDCECTPKYVKAKNGKIRAILPSKKCCVELRKCVKACK